MLFIAIYLWNIIKLEKEKKSNPSKGKMEKREFTKSKKSVKESFKIEDMSSYCLYQFLYLAYYNMRIPFDKM